jgi:methyl-accepting chemotaxis protein
MKAIFTAQHRTNVILFFFVIAVISIFVTNGSVAAESKSRDQQVSQCQDSLIKSQVETAWSMLNEIYTKHKNRELTLEQAKKLGAELLRGLRYGQEKEGYFWADTLEGVNVVLYGKTETEGKNRYNARDIKGTFYVKEFILKGNQPGGGYAEYWYPKLGVTTPLHKRSYVLLFKPFGWVIGTGYYTDYIARQ